MKTILKKISVFFLCVGLLFTVACNADTTDTERNDIPEDLGDAENKLISPDGSSRYTVIHSNHESEEHPLTRAASELCEALQNKLGVNVEFKTDLEENPNSEDVAARYEICVGNTNRPENEQVKSTLEPYAWAIRLVGNKIVITGYDDKAVLTAVQTFVDTYVNGDSIISTALDISGVRELDPIEVFPEDKSTGKVAPSVISTKYPTEDIVIAEIDVVRDGYAVDPTGSSDSTAGIQKALNDVSNAGGGTVWLPAGIYVISDKITIPPFVTLRGDWQDPDTGNEYGTIISIWNEFDEPSEPFDANDLILNEGIFTLGGSGGVVGLTVYYPHQSLTDVKKYPFTFYTNGEGNNYMLSTLKNITVINGYRGIGACCKPSGAHEQLTVENFKGTFLFCGSEVYNQADVGTWQNVSISPKYWQNALNSTTISALSEVEAPGADEISTYTSKKAVGLKLGDLEWTEFSGLTVDSYNIGIMIVQGKRISFAGSLYDISIKNCTKGVVVSDLDQRWGMLIANSTIENGIKNSTTGAVKLCGVKSTGVLKSIATTNNDVDLSAYAIDYTVTYRKPSKADLFLLDASINQEEDCSAAIQALLDAAGKNGGGVVYIPAGYYRLDNPIRVPGGVELRGASSVATRDQGWLSSGTVLMCYYGDDASNGPTDQAFITLSGEYAGINGIRIIYPENGVYDEDLNTTYTVRGEAKGVYMVNCAIAASAYGVDFRGCDEHFIKKVTTCCYYNTFLLGGKGGVLTGCLQNGTVISRTKVPRLENWMSENDAFNSLFVITRQETDYILLDGAKDQLIYNTFIYGCANMIINRNSEGTVVINIGSDNIGENMHQLIMESGSMTVINSMRYNGNSFEHKNGDLQIHNRITIGTKDEISYVQSLPTTVE